MNSTDQTRRDMWIERIEDANDSVCCAVAHLSCLESKTASETGVDMDAITTALSDIDDQLDAIWDHLIGEAS